MISLMGVKDKLATTIKFNSPWKRNRFNKIQLRLKTSKPTQETKRFLNTKLYIHYTI